LSWNVTIATTWTDTYLPASSVTAAAAAEAAASSKEVEYSDLPASYSFQPIAVETLGPINESAVNFLRELGSRIFSRRSDAVCIPGPEAVSHCAVILCSRFSLQLSTRLRPLATNGIVFLAFLFSF